MRDIVRRLMVIVIGITAMLGLLGADQAEAEICDGATGICIVNPPTAASPWLTPQLVQLRLPSEANPAYSGASWTQPGVPGAEYPRALQSGRYPIRGGLQLVEQGPPGGTNLYQGTVEPRFDSERPGSNTFAPVDGALILTVIARHSDPICQCMKETTATFAGLPVLGPFGQFSRRLIKSGQSFRAIMSLEARTPLRLSQIFYVSAYDGKQYDFFPLPLMKRQITGTGPLRIEQKLSASYVHNRCRDYRRCTLYVDGAIGTAAESRLQDGLLDSLKRPVVK